jgi:hypothetical protein
MAQVVSCQPVTVDPSMIPGQSFGIQWWTEWHLDTFFSPGTSVSPCDFHYSNI